MQSMDLRSGCLGMFYGYFDIGANTIICPGIKILGRSQCQSAKAQASQRNCNASPEPSMLAYTNPGCR